VREAALLLSVVLAGCAFGLGGPTETLTPVPGGEADPEFPPGVSERGVSFPGTLAEAHARAIENTSFTLVSNRTVRWANGSVRSGFDVRVRLDRNRTYHATLRTAGPAGPVVLGQPPATAEFWSDGDTYLRALGTGNRTYNEFTPPGNGVATWRYWTRTVAFGGQAGYPGRTIRGVFGSVPTRIADRQAGTGRLRLVGDELTDGDAFPPDVDSPRNLTLVAEVEPSGLVRTLRLRYEGTVDGRPVTVRRYIAYRSVGSTAVGRPAWYGRAIGNDGDSDGQ
jgi:hypothetical protein